MLKKILAILGVLIMVGILAGAFLYWRFAQKNKPPISDEDRQELTLIPLPAKAKLRQSEVRLTEVVSVVWKGQTEPRLKSAWTRFEKTYDLKVNPAAEFVVEITCDSASATTPKPIENESYELSVSPNLIKIYAPTTFGILRGFETLRQLVRRRDSSMTLPALNIQDSPRFPWRGIMIDAGRHFISKESILRNLDLMAAVKLNVLHLHLTEYQGFRIESKVFPKLHELGSGGAYYSQDDMREIVAYAAERGIRVVPEFDMPGHATSWFVGYPELAAKPGPYQLETKYGVLTPIMDPTREEVYDFLDKFFGEMAGIFPDEYFHIGGDEVATVDWQNSAAISAFMTANNLKDYHALQAYFNNRLKSILSRYGKKMVGWDEVLEGEVGSDVLVQCWRSHKSLFEAVQKGNPAILSAGYYLDHKLPAGKHYGIDPEVMAGAVTIEPDSINWKLYNLELDISGTPMKVGMVVYGRKQDNNLRGVFTLMENSTGFDGAVYEGDELVFSFQAEVGEIDVRAKLAGDSANGTMSLGFLSFPFKGIKAGGNDMPGTAPPKIEKIKPLTDEDKTRIIGGEAAMWTELVSDQNLDSRLWPRSAAIAEKFWSPAVLTKDEDDMYRRLNVVSAHLQSLGGKHNTGPQAILSDMAAEKDYTVISLLAECLEEAKYYDRLAADTALSTTKPLNEFVDGLQPESYAARDLLVRSKRFVSDPEQKALAAELSADFQKYADNSSRFADIAVGNPRLEKVSGRSKDVQEVCHIALRSLEAIQNRKPLADSDRKTALQRLDQLQKPDGGIVIAIVAAAKVIVEKS